MFFLYKTMQLICQKPHIIKISNLEDAEQGDLLLVDERLRGSIYVALFVSSKQGLNFELFWLLYGISH